MKKYTPKELKTILDKHLKWLFGDGGERADLSSADLRYADLSSADLRYADLSYADLRSADLRYADLSSADLSYAKNIFWLKRLLVNKKTVLKYLGFKVYKKYFIAYKSFNENKTPPKKWIIERNSTIKEHLDNDIYNTCSRGVNVGTMKWCKNNCNKQIWEVKVKFDADICIPIYTDGKIRVDECQLVKEIKRGSK